MNITCIGMGLMGIPMSKNLLIKGWNTTLYNRTPGKVGGARISGCSRSDEFRRYSIYPSDGGGGHYLSGISLREVLINGIKCVGSRREYFYTS